MSSARPTRPRRGHIGTNYLDVCDRATGVDAACASAAAAGIRSVLAGQPAFSLEYPCHSPTEQRWFQLRASRLDHEGAAYAVVAHHDITNRILVEQERQGLLARAHRYQEQLKALATCHKHRRGGCPEIIFRDITEQARLIVGAHWASTHTIPYALWPKNPVIVSVSEKYRGYSPRRSRRSGIGIYTHVVQTGQPVRLNEAELNSHPDLQGVRNTEADLLVTEGVLAVPITGAQGGMLGVIMLSDKERGAFTPNDEAILVQLAQIAAVAAKMPSSTGRTGKPRAPVGDPRARQRRHRRDQSRRKFVTVNKGLSSITGYSRNELLDLSLFDLFRRTIRRPRRPCTSGRSPASCRPIAWSGALSARTGRALG